MVYDIYYGIYLFVHSFIYMYMYIHILRDQFLANYPVSCDCKFEI